MKIFLNQNQVQSNGQTVVGYNCKIEVLSPTGTTLTGSVSTDQIGETEGNKTFKFSNDNRAIVEESNGNWGIFQGVKSVSDYVKHYEDTPSISLETQCEWFSYESDGVVYKGYINTYTDGTIKPLVLANGDVCAEWDNQASEEDAIECLNNFDENED